MSNVIKFSINGDTNADQVTEKVKKSVSALEKNIEGIENRFKSFGKDLFLSFAAPMVLLNSAMNMISSAIERNQQKVQDAHDLAVKGESRFVDKGTVTVARENENRRRELAEKELAKIATERETKEALEQGGFAGFGGEADEVLAEYNKRNAGFLGDIKSMMMYFGLTDMSKNEEIQAIVAERSAGRVSSDPETIAKKNAEAAAAKQKEAAESQIAAQKEVDRMPTSFKGPEGFGNVIGVGANPVLEAMASQLEEVKKTNDLLSQLVTSGGGRTSSWLDAPTGATSTAAPSRAAMLSGKR
jgi:hypothetical protein